MTGPTRMAPPLPLPLPRGARVLMTVFPEASHLYPLVPFAWALRAAGHEVRLAVPPAFAETAGATGLPVVRVGRDADVGRAWQGFAPAGDPRRNAWQRTVRTMAMFTDAADAVTEDLTRLAGEWADVVLFEPRAYAGPLAAARAGRPAVRFLYGVDHTYRQRAEEWPLLEPLWRRWGMAGPPDPLGGLTLDPCPAALQVDTPPGSRPLRYVPFNGASAVPALPPPGARPRVCVTWGMSFASATGHLEPLRRTLAALAAQDCEPVVLVTGAQRALLGEVPDGVRVLESVPLHTVLPGSALLVHQGGAGATMTASAYGVPQLTVPGKGDQILNAHRVTAAGVGRSLPGESGLGPLVARMLGDRELRTTAAEVALENAARPSPAEAARAVTWLTPAGTSS